MELPKKPDLKFKGESSLHTGICGQTQLCQEKLLCLGKNFLALKWGKIFHARANLGTLSCIVCPWWFFFFFPLDIADAFPRKTIYNWYKPLVKTSRRRNVHLLSDTTEKMLYFYIHVDFWELWIMMGRESCDISQLIMKTFFSSISGQILCLLLLSFIYAWVYYHIRRT